MKWTDEQLAQYNEQGYLFMPGLLSADEVDGTQRRCSAFAQWRERRVASGTRTRRCCASGLSRPSER